MNDILAVIVVVLLQPEGSVTTSSEIVTVNQTFASRSHCELIAPQIQTQIEYTILKTHRVQKKYISGTYSCYDRVHFSKMNQNTGH